MTSSVFAVLLTLATSAASVAQVEPAASAAPARQATPATPAARSEPATPAVPTLPPAPSSDEYVLIVGRQTIGTETVSRTKTEAGEILRGTADVTTPAGIIHFSQILEHVGGKTTRYELEIEGGPSGAKISAAPSEVGWRFQVEQGEATPPTVVERPGSASSHLIDNNLASHLDLLSRTLALTPGTKAEATAVVPQVLQVLPFEIARMDDRDGTRHYRLTMASVVIELVARAVDGALLEARVPMQNATYRRKGWDPPESPAAGADPRSREIAVPSPLGDLPATIVLPASEKPSAGVLLLSGSGPNDRDETIGPNKPLRDLAIALADRGIATLRFDKRTRAFPVASEATLAAEYLEDASKALDILRRDPGVDPKLIFVGGHSLGGTVAPLVAARAGEAVRGLILLAPAVRRVDDMVIDQVTTQTRIAGLDEATARAQIAEITGALARALDPANEDAGPVLGAPAAYWRELAALDLVKMLGESPLPVLVLQGEKDIQVRADLDFGRLRSRLGDVKGRVTYKLLPGLNHLFMKVDGPSTGAEYAMEGRMAPEVAEAVTAWVARIGP